MAVNTVGLLLRRLAQRRTGASSSHQHLVPERVGAEAAQDLCERSSPGASGSGLAISANDEGLPAQERSLLALPDIRVYARGLRRPQGAPRLGGLWDESLPGVYAPGVLPPPHST